MRKLKSLNEVVQFNSSFKTAVNLYLSLNKKEKVLSYIPTKSSLQFIDEYLNAVIENKEQATLLVGPYGKGKSHLLLPVNCCKKRNNSIVCVASGTI